MARIPQALHRAVLAAAQDRCAYGLSPEQMMGVAFEIDHILPSSAGGRTQFNNLCFVAPPAIAIKPSVSQPEIHFPDVSSHCSIPTETYGLSILRGALIGCRSLGLRQPGAPRRKHSVLIARR